MSQAKLPRPTRKELDEKLAELASLMGRKVGDEPGDLRLHCPMGNAGPYLIALVLPDGTDDYRIIDTNVMKNLSMWNLLKNSINTLKLVTSSHKLLTYTGKGPSTTGFNEPLVPVDIIKTDQHIAVNLEPPFNDDFNSKVAIERRADGPTSGFSVGIQVEGDVRLTVFVSDGKHISVKDANGDWLYGCDEQGHEVEEPEWDTPFTPE